jgi:hypothetical protein
MVAGLVKALASTSWLQLIGFDVAQLHHRRPD